jgi:hypothetical protein
MLLVTCQQYELLRKDQVLDEHWNCVSRGGKGLREMESKTGKLSGFCSAGSQNTLPFPRTLGLLGVTGMVYAASKTGALFYMETVWRPHLYCWFSAD